MKNNERENNMKVGSRNAVKSKIFFFVLGSDPCKVLKIMRARTTEAKDIKAMVRTAHPKPMVVESRLNAMGNMTPPVIISQQYREYGRENRTNQHLCPEMQHRAQTVDV